MEIEMTDTTTETIDLANLEWLESLIADRGPHDAIEYLSDEDRVLDLLNREEVAHMRTKVNLQDAIARAEKAEAERDAAISAALDMAAGIVDNHFDAWDDRIINGSALDITKRAIRAITVADVLAKMVAK